MRENNTISVVSIVNVVALVFGKSEPKDDHMFEEVECATCNLKGSFAGAKLKTARMRLKVSSRVATVTARVTGRVTSVALCGE